MFVVVVFVKHNLFVKKIMKIAYRSKGYNFISKMLSTSSELKKKSGYDNFNTYDVSGFKL